MSGVQRWIIAISALIIATSALVTAYTINRYAVLKAGEYNFVVDKWHNKIIVPVKPRQP